MSARRRTTLGLALIASWLAATAASAQQTAELLLPDAPQPQLSAGQAANPASHRKPYSGPCRNQDPKLVPEQCGPRPIPPVEALQRFVSTPHPQLLTPETKFHLAVNNVRDPFNLASIAFFSAIDVASDSHGPYGPGMPGFAKDFGTTLTEDINGQFWSTFVVASVAREDPHYHRMPNATIKRRILHCFDAVIIAQSDRGNPMPNFDNLVGSPIAASINNLYVPYPRTNVPATVDRVLAGYSFDPVSNAITEFLPDVAKRVNVRIVFVQQIMNKLYQSQSGGASLQ